MGKILNKKGLVIFILVINFVLRLFKYIYFVEFLIYPLILYYRLGQDLLSSLSSDFETASCLFAI